MIRGLIGVVALVAIAQPANALTRIRGYTSDGDLIVALIDAGKIKLKVDGYPIKQLPGSMPIPAVVFNLTDGGQSDNLTYAMHSRYNDDIVYQNIDYTASITSQTSFYDATHPEAVSIYSLAPGDLGSGRLDYSTGYTGYAGGAVIKELHTDFTITQVVLNAQAVPEPASWALMFAGFGLVGRAARIRKTRLRLG